ncbi:aminotransferase class IV [Winogradskyella aurantiaca]|uniref:aminotransferase class IV n=1 Tax=Winogradskyella aurantiaca TaxID=2219558 RepID=UPI000E1C9C48|nr:aminotransferase class IV [Winogradskyella aurantiaca]
MVNSNGHLLAPEQAHVSISNRAYNYGDGLFETIKAVNGKLFFWEDHYFRLMSSMRIMRMEIPMDFTMEFLEAEILKTLEANNLIQKSARVRVQIDRGEGGLYLPLENTEIRFLIKVTELDSPFYTIDDAQTNLVDIYKDFYVAPGLLSGLKSNNKALNVMGSIYAKENGYNNCLLVNTNKNVIEALNGNLFLVKGDRIKTPPLTDGCLKGVMRKQILELLLEDLNYITEEESISPFELQKADELFITNVVQGIVPITQYRKKSYQTDFSKGLIKKLNVKIRLA